MELDDDVDLDDFAVRTDSYSGSDITNLCRDAAMMSMRRAIKASWSVEGGFPGCVTTRL
jgi:katanin p60 ATPase-containing subunit A1